MHFFVNFFAKFALKFDFIGILVAFCTEIEPNSILVNGRNFWGIIGAKQCTLCWMASNTMDDVLNPNAISGNG